jgi:endonuclease III-like uncharacterized protein
MNTEPNGNEEPTADEKELLAYIKTEGITKQDLELLGDMLRLQTKRHQQVDGKHYTGLAIEPLAYAELNGLGAIAFSVVKYVTRAEVLVKDSYGLDTRDKTAGRVKAVSSLRKAKDFINRALCLLQEPPQGLDI